MIRADINEQFPIVTSLVDECTGQLVSGQTVTYRILDTNDNNLLPAIYGTLIESSYEQGIYKEVESIPESGEFVCYVTCSGFSTNTEDIIINPENIYDLVKEGRHYNISVEDVIRENVTPTASQTSRNVPLGKTDYVVNNIKPDSDIDWSGTTISGIVYAHYKTLTDDLPYKMAGPF